MSNNYKVAVIHVAKYVDNNDRLCHHNCLFCMERMEPGASNELLPELQVINNALKHYKVLNGKIGKLYIAGGEPTLRHDFVELIKLVHQFSDNIVLSTCCDFVDEDAIIHSIQEVGINMIATSIHSSDEKIHDFLTGKPGSFRRTISAVKKMISLGMIVSVNSVINSFNISQVPDIVCFFKKELLNINKLTLTHYLHHGNAYYHDELRFNVDEYPDIIHKAINAAKIVDYSVTFRNFPLCLDINLKVHSENVEDIDIINLDNDTLSISSESAPTLIKEKCRQCEEFNLCPKYLAANYER